MIKAILLAGAAAFALGGAAVAQDAGVSATGDAAATQGTVDAGASGTTAAPADSTVAPADTTAPADAAATGSTSDSTASTTSPTDAVPSAPPPPASASAVPAAPVDGAKAQQAAATVQADWAKTDKEKKGSLTPLEFGTWVLAASGQDMTAQVEKTKTGKQANLPAVKVLNATAAEFSKADKDRNRMISPDELTDYLSA